MASHRMERVNELVREEVSRILLVESQDPRFKMVTVTGARVTADLHYAKVYVAIHGDEEERKSILKALDKAKGFVRKLLGENIRMKYTPEITFEYDDSLDRANEIFKKLEELNIHSDETDDTEELEQV